MFPPLVRWTLALAFLAAAAFLASRDPVPAAGFLLAAAALVYAHFRNGTVWLAFHALRGGDSEEARRLLDAIRRPGWLDRQSRAYYEWIRGTLALEAGNREDAVDRLRAALEGGLRTDHDRCVVACVLADTLLDLGGREEAAALLRRARALPHREELDPEIDRVESRLA